MQNRAETCVAHGCDGPNGETQLNHESGNGSSPDQIAQTFGAQKKHGYLDQEEYDEANELGQVRPRASWKGVGDAVNRWEHGTQADVGHEAALPCLDAAPDDGEEHAVQHHKGCRKVPCKLVNLLFRQHLACQETLPQAALVATGNGMPYSNPGHADTRMSDTARMWPTSVSTMTCHQFSPKLNMLEPWSQ